MDRRNRPQISSKLLQRITANQSSADPFQSASKGVADPHRQSQSFSAKQQTDKNRQIIKRYGYSKMGTQHIRSDVRRYGAEMGHVRQGQAGSFRSRTGTGEVSGSSLRIQGGARNRPDTSFKEPPPRYNPYA